MLKRKLLLMTSLVLVNLFKAGALAGEIEAQPRSLFSHGYLGIGLGPDLLFVKETPYTQISGESIPLVVNLYKAPLGNVGFIGNIHLGYGHSFHNCFYLGTELFGEWYTHSVQFTSLYSLPPLPLFEGREIHRFAVKNAYGLLIRPGLHPTPETIIYLSLGAAFTKIKERNIFLETEGAPSLSVTDNKNHFSKAGFRVGLGTAFALAKDVVFRLDYFYTTYGRVTHSLNFIPIGIVGEVTEFLSVRDVVKISTHTITFNVDYLF
jgi:opacity protein-like surface antigen